MKLNAGTRNNHENTKQENEPGDINNYYGFFVREGKDFYILDVYTDTKFIYHKIHVYDIL